MNRFSSKLINSKGGALAMLYGAGLKKKRYWKTNYWYRNSHS